MNYQIGLLPVELRNQVLLSLTCLLSMSSWQLECDVDHLWPVIAKSVACSKYKNWVFDTI